MKQQFTVRNMVLIALFTAILSVSVYLSVPLPNGSHITFFNFVVTIIILVFSVRDASMSIIIWLLLGALGVPVFVSGNAGLGYLLSPYGGYNFGFLVCAIIIPAIRGKKYNRVFYTLISLLGAVLVDVIGAIWWMVLGNLTLKQAIVMGVLAFLPLDCVKAVVAAQIVPVFRKLMPLNENVKET